MNEEKVISVSKDLVTRRSLAADLRELGLRQGMTVLVHSSLSSIGWVSGGPVAVIQGLMDAVGKDGTLVMPAHSGDYSDPADWSNPPVPEEWHQEIRDTMPAYHPGYTPARGIGTIPELFRSFPGTARSGHPQYSFSAWGKNKKMITEKHPYDYGLGENSPLGRLYDNDAMVLFLGTGYDSNTSFHLAEHLVPYRKETVTGAPVFNNGERVWETFRNIEFNDDVFEIIGQEFEQNAEVRKGKAGGADCRLFRQKAAVDFAVEWLTDYCEKERS
ncbi:aminoglycoside N(3)-acetyltransferase [Bacillus marinisedimentorum]|uniref:aminoglycoside N(3)-acetyltransferase n=1 Tax=Bacillus marinisedimentorum TaxID=1821260 RepID=UPI0007DE5B6A|nr:AAC(3) family N-acetyltransferase [Bacillus marinisedimentorum]